MLRFAVYDAQGPARRWPLVGAHLLGPEDVAVVGRIDFAHGRITVKRGGTQAVALCLQYDAGIIGRFMLQTCLLPDRERPYLLSVELARHRIKAFIVKSEEWQMFELSSAHPAMERWEQARHAFTEAITAGDPIVADRAARQSLMYGIDACERLALAHAEILLHMRFGQRAASSTTLGVRVWPRRDAQPLRDLLGKEFDVVSIPLTWRHLEVEEGQYQWSRTDRWMEWAQSAGKPVLAGPLLDFSKRSIPEWLYVWQHDYDTCRDLAYDHVERLVQRYGGTVGMWNLAAGLNLNDNFQFAPEQMIDLIRMAALKVKENRRKARTMVEIDRPFGEAISRGRGALAPLVFLDRLNQEGIRLDAVGIRLLIGSPAPGLAARDLMALSALLDRFYFLELPVLVTAAGTTAAAIDEKGGTWHDPWTPDVQARWAAAIFAVAMSKPFVESFVWCDLYDHDDAELPGGALISDGGRTRPALSKLVGVRKRLRKPLGQLRSGVGL